MRGTCFALALLSLLVAAVGGPLDRGSRAGGDHPGSGSTTTATSFRLAAGVGELQSRRALRAASWHGGVVTASTGEPVRVEVSDAYAPEAVSPQVWADFFAGLAHGDELGRVTVRIAPPAEIRSLCGSEQALGCYGGGELILPGEAANGVTPEEIARHEYGHHVAANRLNPPWRALDWGPKRWSTREGVCARQRAGTAYPGNEDGRYRLNPGEAFAEAYRVLNERRAGLPLTWSLVDSSYLPDDADLAAVEQDVVAPWLRATSKVYRAQFRATGSKRWRTGIATPLDGLVSVVFRLPAGSLHSIRVVGPDGRELARGAWAGTRVQRLSYQVCGTRTATVVVTRNGPPGPVSVTVTKP